MSVCEHCGGCRTPNCNGECNAARCKCRFWISALPVLAHNLAVAGALSRSFLLGSWYGLWEGGCRVSSDDPDEINPSWRPGWVLDEGKR